MEPGNRPYVDPATEPGDAGTNDWADGLQGSDSKAERATSDGPVAKTDADGVVDGSPADEFINDPEAIGGRNVEIQGA